MTKALLVMIALLATSSAQAQDVGDVGDVRVVSDQDIQLSDSQRSELKQWTKEVESYRQWYEKNRNRVSYTAFGSGGERRKRPAIPEWLPGKCDLLADFAPRPDGPLPDGCNLLSYYQRDFTSDPAAQQALMAQKQNEQDPHSSFWKHVHLDAGWSSLDYRMHTYGVVGVHVTLPELAKRVQIFLPPGFLLLSIPDGRGGHDLQPAATIGVSIKMFRFDFPQGKEGMAYFNLAKAYLISRGSMATNPSVDLLGLSFSWGH
jgi:hypothetical protein